MEVERYKMIYKINKNLYNNIKLNNKIRIFGHNFVKNNKNKAKLIINNKKYKLEEYINNNNINSKELTADKLKIGIVLNKGLSNVSHIFENCRKLIKFLYYDNIINIDELDEYNYYNNIDNDYDDINTSQNNLDINLKEEFIYSKIPKKYIIFIKKYNYFSNMSRMFYNCSSLISLPDISEWNTDFVIDMNCVFYNCSSLLSLPDISGWTTENVTDLSRMFYNCKSLLSLPDISKWATYKVNLLTL